MLEYINKTLIHKSKEDKKRIKNKFKGGSWGTEEGDSEKKRLGLSERHPPSSRKHGTASRRTGRCSANKNPFFVLFYTTCAVPRSEDRGRMYVYLFGSA